MCNRPVRRCSGILDKVTRYPGGGAAGGSTGILTSCRQAAGAATPPRPSISSFCHPLCDCLPLAVRNPSWKKCEPATLTSVLFFPAPQKASRLAGHNRPGSACGIFRNSGCGHPPLIIRLYAHHFGGLPDIWICLGQVSRRPAGPRAADKPRYPSLASVILRVHRIRRHRRRRTCCGKDIALAPAVGGGEPL